MKTLKNKYKLNNLVSVYYCHFLLPFVVKSACHFCKNKKIKKSSRTNISSGFLGRGILLLKYHNFKFWVILHSIIMNLFNLFIIAKGYFLTCMLIVSNLSIKITFSVIITWIMDFFRTVLCETLFSLLIPFFY